MLPAPIRSAVRVRILTYTRLKFADVGDIELLGTALDVDNVVLPRADATADSDSDCCDGDFLGVADVPEQAWLTDEQNDQGEGDATRALCDEEPLPALDLLLAGDDDGEDLLRITATARHR